MSIDYESMSSLSSILVEDVSANGTKLKNAFTIIAKEYSKLSTNVISPKELYDELCDDIYYSSNRSKTLLATGFNPNTNRVEPLATVRVILPLGLTSQNVYPLDFMNLVSPREGWKNFQFEGFNPEYAVELSRFAIDSACRIGASKKTGLSILIVKKLIDTAVEMVRINRYSQIWALMPCYVARLVSAAGFNLMSYSSVVLSYNNYKWLFDKYDKYWIKGKISLNKILY